MSYVNSVTVAASYDVVVARTRASLAEQGFGILTEINVRETFAKKLGAESADALGDYLILGACVPRMAERALAADPNMGALLPCNVIIRRSESAEVTTVQAIDPQTMVQLSDAPEIADVATEVSKLLQAVLASIQKSEGTPPPDRP
ncbi:MAG: DUF302 domain-containing protein [Microbacteriaceae bacterium]|nr:DUF302 domain-containing protein [Microbacteriaceae bacterium]